jgi:hypothetical protein
MDKNTNERRVTNEKPISLFPLDFKEAVAALLKVKPKPKENSAVKKSEQRENN